MADSSDHGDRAGQDPAGDPASEHREIANLVKQYFNVCNAALTHGADGPVSQALLDGLARFAHGETIVLEVAESGAAEAPCYTTRFVDGQFTPVREGVHDPQARFTLTRDFLEKVADDAASYIDNPQRLDWSWVRDRD